MEKIFPDNFMSKLSERFRAVKIYNTHDILKLAGACDKMAIACSYSPSDGTGFGCSKSTVWSPHFKTNPDSSWYDYGCMTFVGKRVESMPKALAWASNQYGIKEWVNCPMNTTDKIPQHVLAIATAWLKHEESKLIVA
jgi:hypothetical protein